MDRIVPEFNESDAGKQIGWFEDKEVIVKGKGKITQINMDDTLKLKNYQEQNNGQAKPRN